MIHIAICDDDSYMTGYIENLVLKECRRWNLCAETEVFFDGNQLIAYVENISKFDVIFLDIEMKHQNGIQTAQQIRQTDTLALLIFISHHDSYLKALFEVQPFWFLDKPVDEQIFRTCFGKAMERLEKNRQAFHYKTGKTLHRVPVQDILYLESDRRQIHIHMKSQEISFYGKLDEAEVLLKKLEGRFLRIHQSYLVNLLYIRTMTAYYVELEDGNRLNVSTERRKSCKEEYAVLLGRDIVG
ncbi:MAG: LytR/AlgR family response regulator transcription factor [Lachnospiraceae bacterium]